jgi:hypothetical protein
MLRENKHWDALVKSLSWGSRRSFAETIIVAFAFPLVESYLVNIWTGAPDPSAGVARNLLIGVAFLHVLLGSMLLAGERTTDLKALADAVETMSNYEDLNRELNRRTKSYGMVVAAVDEFNKRTCSIDPWCESGFEEGLRHIINHFTQNIRTTLGVDSNKYTIEVHLDPQSVEHPPHAHSICPGHNGLCLEFFTGHQVERTAPMSLTNNSPVNLALAKCVPCEQHIAADRPLFYDGDAPKAEVYFRRYAALIFPWACSSESLGVIVLTSAQDEPFADDVLETLRFMGSLVANYVSSYGRCAAERAAARAEAQPGWSRSSKSN